MLNFDEVYISDIPPAVSIATWYIQLYTYLTVLLKNFYLSAMGDQISKGLESADTPEQIMVEAEQRVKEAEESVMEAEHCKNKTVALTQLGLSQLQLLNQY